MTTQELIDAAKEYLEAGDAYAVAEPGQVSEAFRKTQAARARLRAALSACEGEIDYKAEYERAKREASDLATWLWKKHYQQDAPNWGLCDTAAGILTQIDNMVCTLVKADSAACEGEKAGEAKAHEPWSEWIDWQGGECPIPWAEDGDWGYVVDSRHYFTIADQPAMWMIEAWRHSEGFVAIRKYRYRFDRAPKE